MLIVNVPIKIKQHEDAMQYGNIAQISSPLNYILL